MYRFVSILPLYYILQWLFRLLDSNVMYLVMGTWIVQNAWLASWWPAPKMYIYCCFLVKGNTFLYDIWVGQLVANIGVCQFSVLILMFQCSIILVLYICIGLDSSIKDYLIYICCL